MRLLCKRVDTCIKLLIHSYFTQLEIFIFAPLSTLSLSSTPSDSPLYMLSCPLPVPCRPPTFQRFETLWGEGLHLLLNLVNNLADHMVRAESQMGQGSLPGFWRLDMKLVRPITRFDGPACRKLIKCRDLWLNLLVDHPLYLVFVDLWNVVAYGLMIMGLDRGQLTEAILSGVHAACIRFNSIINFLGVPYELGGISLAYGWKVYDHVFGHHLQDFLLKALREGGPGPGEVSSSWLERLNQLGKQLLRQHSSQGGGRAGGRQDPLEQVFRYALVLQKPGIRRVMWGMGSAPNPYHCRQVSMLYS